MAKVYKIVARSDDTVNPNIPTGEVELVIAELVVQSAAEPLPQRDESLPHTTGGAVDTEDCLHE